MATLHKSCGLGTKVFVVAGDAETEEGISYEFRNKAISLGMDNLTVMLDWNEFTRSHRLHRAAPIRKQVDVGGI